MKKVRFWAVLAIGFMSVMSLKAQSQRMSEFQNEFGKYQNQYRDLMHNGKHKDAMAPLTSCIALLDTTTIFKVAPIPEAAIKEQKRTAVLRPGVLLCTDGAKETGTRGIGAVCSAGLQRL